MVLHRILILVRKILRFMAPNEAGRRVVVVERTIISAAAASSITSECILSTCGISSAKESII